MYVKHSKSLMALAWLAASCPHVHGVGGCPPGVIEVQQYDCQSGNGSVRFLVSGCPLHPDEVIVLVSGSDVLFEVRDTHAQSCSEYDDAGCPGVPMLAYAVATIEGLPPGVYDASFTYVPWANGESCCGTHYCCNDGGPCDEPAVIPLGALVLVCAGDLNCDGDVDVFDLLILLGAWGPCPDCPKSPCPADLNGDCSVDVFDLLVLLGEWG
jgi:hypothetical protein